MERSLIQGPFVVLALLVAQSAHAQDAPAFVRRSTLPTPIVTDVEVLRQQRIEVPSLVILSDPQRSTVLQLDLFADVSFRALRERLEPTLHGISWIGKLEGYPESDAIFVLVEDELIGHIWTPFGFFRIERQRDRGYLVQQVNQSAFPEAPDTVELAPGPVNQPRADDRLSTRADDGSVVDVLVAYTREALVGFGSEARALASIDLAVAETNQALRTSRIPTQVRTIHTTVVDYAETGDWDIDRRQLQNLVGETRDRYAADINAFIVERRPPNIGCGLARPGSRNIPANEAWLIVERRCTGAGGTFAHEAGHTLGAHHDWYVEGPSTAEQWRPNYSHGFISLSGRFRDVMAYTNLCSVTRTECPRLLAYSNPAILHNGRPVGVPGGTNVTCTPGDVNNPDCDADNAQFITEMAPIVARHRHSLTALRARQLLPGGAFRSGSGRYRLTYQTDGNLVLYDEGMPLWATNTSTPTPREAILQTDGNFVVYDRNGSALWASQTGGNTNAYLVVQDDGNFVIYNADGRAIWSSSSP